MRVLIVDDSPGDVRLLQEAFAAHCPQCVLDVAPQLDAARGLLIAERYGLVVLDINLPGGTGLDLLDEPGAESLCFVVFSTSDAEAEVQAARRRGAADFIVKPRDWGGYGDAVKRMLGATSARQRHAAP